MYRELPRGCLNTYFTIECPEKKRPNLTEGHALYGCGHLIEAAAAYVYCLEQVDNGCNLASLFVSPEAEISQAAPEESLPGTLPTLLVPGERLVQTTGTDDLRLPDGECDPESRPLPLWCNREPGEMLVWLHARV